MSRRFEDDEFCTPSKMFASEATKTVV